jgi:Flp pilus assembly pilin Flp
VCKDKQAQSIIEYAIVLSLVTAVFIGMQTYLKRGVQAAVKISTDRMGTQVGGAPVVNRGGGIEEDFYVGTTTKPKGNNWSRKEVLAGRARAAESSQSHNDLATCGEKSPPVQYYDPRDWSTLHTYHETENDWSDCWNMIEETKPDGTTRYRLEPRWRQNGS